MPWLIGGIEVVTYAGVAAALVGLAAILAPPLSPRAVAVTVLGVLVACYATAQTLALDGSFASAGPRGVPNLAWIGLPLTAALLVVVLSPSLGRLLRTPGLTASLTALQTYRVEGGVFLVLLAMHRLPALFAVPAGVGDLLVGITAWSVAGSLRAGRRGRAIAWNLLGLLDLTVAVTLGVACLPQFHPSSHGVTTAPLAYLPLALIPVFLVPLSILLHAAGLRSLWMQSAGARRRAQQGSRAA